MTRRVSPGRTRHSEDPSTRVLLVEAGLLAVLGLVWVLADFWREAVWQRQETTDHFDRALMAAVAGAMAVLLLGSFTSSFLVRGPQLIAALLLAIPAALALGPTPPAAKHQAAK